MKEIWAIVPARGGSKGLPGKNLRTLGGWPLLRWAIEAARATADLSRVIVSTDSAEIARLARRTGAEVPFLRPRRLATDRASLASAVNHTVDEIAASDGPPDAILVLYPTSPFRRPEILDAALGAVRSYAQVSSCMPLDVVPAHWRVTNDAQSAPVGERTDPVRLYYPTGTFTAFAYRPPALRPREAMAEWHRYLTDRHGNAYRPGAAMRVIRDPLAAVDIDDAEDLARAEALLAGERIPWPSPVTRLPFCVVGGTRVHPAASLLGERATLRIGLEAGARYLLFVTGQRRDGGPGGGREFHELVLQGDGSLVVRPLFGGPPRIEGDVDGDRLTLRISAPPEGDHAVVALAREAESDLCDFVKPFSLPPFWAFDPRAGRSRCLRTGREIRGRQDGPRIERIDDSGASVTRLRGRRRPLPALPLLDQS